MVSNIQSFNGIGNYNLPNYYDVMNIYNSGTNFNQKNTNIQPSFNSCYPQPFGFPNFSPQNQHVGFWEGTKAFFKGLVKPIKNMITHPIKTVLFIAGTAALIIGTGGAATPFLIGAGVALGGWQVAKGTYNAINSNNRYETLAALEDVGEGTFTLGASVAGAKSYMSSTSAGSATAAASEQTSFGSKAATYAEGLFSDTVNTLRAVPKSAETTLNMIASGEFSGNLQSFGASTKLAMQHRNLAKLRQAKSPQYAAAKKIYDANLQAYNLKYGVIKPDQIANKYMDLYEKFGFDSTNATGTRFINDLELVRVASIRALKNHANIFRNLPETNMAIAFNSAVNVDPEIQQAIDTYAPYCLN